MHPLTKLQLVILDLLNYDEQLIKRGEVNQIRVDDEANYIVVNSLSPATAVTKGKSYDDAAEVLTVGVKYRMPVTVDFFGIDAYENAVKFQLMLKTDMAADLQNLHKMTIMAASSLADVKQLTGNQYINRYQLTLNLLYNESVALDTMCIDVAVIDFKNNE